MATLSEWGRGAVELLIAGLLQHPCLYDTHHVDYYNRTARTVAYANIADSVSIQRPGTVAEDVKRKVNNMRTQYSRALMSSSSSWSSCTAPGRCLSNCKQLKPWWFPSMEFLRGHMQTRGNITVNRGANSDSSQEQATLAPECGVENLTEREKKRRNTDAVTSSGPRPQRTGAGRGNATGQLRDGTSTGFHSNVRVSPPLAMALLEKYFVDLGRDGKVNRKLKCRLCEGEKTTISGKPYANHYRHLERAHPDQFKELQEMRKLVNPHVHDTQQAKLPNLDSKQQERETFMSNIRLYRHKPEQDERYDMC